MTKSIEHLKRMISLAGLSGYEDPIRTEIKKTWSPLVDQTTTSKLGSLHALRKGIGKEPRNSMLIATHMDAIGLMVTRIDQEFLHVTQIGGIDPRVLPGQLVTVHGTEELQGIIVLPPAHTLPEKYHDGPVPLEHLLVDIGLTQRQVEQKVEIGDLVSFATEPTELGGNFIAGHSLDNRASVAVLTECLTQLQTRIHNWDVWAVATTQEEETLGGAFTSGFDIQPDIGVVIDVNFAKGPGAGGHSAFDMDKGPTFDWGPNTHPKLYHEFEKLAKQLEIKYQRSVYQRMSGTDAMALQIAGNGIPTMILGIPLRYMHTPVEMIQAKDIDRTARLLAEFICTLDEDFMNKLAFEEKEK